jgi:hypothetical protein
MQVCNLKSALNASRADALLEATNLIQVAELVHRRGPSFVNLDASANIGLYNLYSLKTLRAEGVSGAAIRLLKAIQRKPNDLDSRYFGRVNRRLETKLLLLATIAADMNKEFLENASSWNREVIAAESRRTLMKLDMNEDIWSWFEFAVRLPLYSGVDEGQSIRLIAPNFEGIAKTEQEFMYTLAQVKKRLGTIEVIHQGESCPECISKPDTQDMILGHTLKISLDFARALERQTNFTWTDRPADHLGPYLRRLPTLDDSKNYLTFGLILERNL